MTNPLRAHWTLDREIRFLNHGSFGATPRVVLEAQAEWRARMEREPVLFLARELEGLVDAARAAIAAFVGAPIEDLVPVNNATTGVNAVVRSLDFLPGDELLVTSMGYNACNNAIDHAARCAGAQIVVAEIPFPIASEEEVLESVLAHATARTRLALLDHITSPTGLVFPIERLVRALEARGIDTVVDGAHAPGMVDLDLGKLNPAYYTGNLHKWACAPKGAAFLYVRRDRQARIRPPVISHGANSGRTDRSRYRLEFDYMGTDDPTAFLATPTALAFLGDLFPSGWDELRRHNRALALCGRERLLSALEIDAPAPEAMIGSLASVPLPTETIAPAADIFSVDPLQRWLFEEHRIEVPIFNWPTSTQRVLRISAQAYNEIGEYEALASALAESRQLLR